MSIASAATRVALVAVALLTQATATVASDSNRSFASNGPTAHALSVTSDTRKLALGVANLPSTIESFDAFTASVGGHAPALWAIWNDWGGATPEFPMALAEQVATRGSVPMVWWQPVTSGQLDDTTFSNERIVAGAFDEYISLWATNAKAFGQLVVVRFAHEMDGNWFPWGVGRNGNTAANFIAAWRHIVDIFRGPNGVGANNVRFLWSPYGPNASLYPGAGYVDYTGFTALNWGRSYGQPWRSMNNILSGLVAGARGFGKPIIVAELGSPPDEQGGSKAAWIQTGYAKAFARYPEIVAMVYFNVDTSPGQPDWRLTNPPAALDAYRAVVAQSQFQGSLLPTDPPPGDVTPPVVQAPRAALLASKPVVGKRAWLRVNWAAAADESGVSNYQLEWRQEPGRWRDVSLDSPTALSVDVLLPTGKKHQFRLRARDAAGNWSTWSESGALSLRLFQERSRPLKYTGIFERTRVVGASGRFVSWSSTAGDKLRVKFSGVGVAWVSTIDSNMGVGEVWLDGDKVAEVDLAGGRAPGTVVWSSATVPGRHVLEIRVAGTHAASSISSRIDIDAVLILR